MAEARKAGIYNATGPDYRLAMGALLDTCKAVSGGDARFIWVSEPFLLEHEVEPFMEMPLWVPESAVGIHQVNVGKAIADGLTFRPLADTVRDTLEWDRTRSGDEWKNKAGMSPEREQAWKESSQVNG